MPQQYWPSPARRMGNGSVPAVSRTYRRRWARQHAVSWPGRTEQSSANKPTSNFKNFGVNASGCR